MNAMEEKTKHDIHNHFEKGSNCQVFNGDIRDCVFAMPGANVTQQMGEKPKNLSDEEQEIVNQLKPLFYGSEADARSFLVSIQGMKPSQITSKVNQLVKEKKISEMSQHRKLWTILHECGLYAPTESNWNMQVK